MAGANAVSEIAMCGLCSFPIGGSCESPSRCEWMALRRGLDGLRPPKPHTPEPENAEDRAVQAKTLSDKHGIPEDDDAAV